MMSDRYLPKEISTHNEFSTHNAGAENRELADKTRKVSTDNAGGVNGIVWTLLGLGLAACGGGGGGPVTKAPAAPAPKTGHAADGPLVGAKLFHDENNDGAQDNDEQDLATTGAGGAFSLPAQNLPAGVTSLDDLTINTDGATDEVTNRQLDGALLLKSVKGGTTFSTISTIMRAAADKMIEIIRRPGQVELLLGGEDDIRQTMHEYVLLKMFGAPSMVMVADINNIDNYDADAFALVDGSPPSQIAAKAFEIYQLAQLMRADHPDTQLTQQQIVDALLRHVMPNNAALLTAGDAQSAISLKQLKDLVESLFSGTSDDDPDVTLKNLEDAATQRFEELNKNPPNLAKQPDPVSLELKFAIVEQEFVPRQRTGTEPDLPQLISMANEGDIIRASLGDVRGEINNVHYQWVRTENGTSTNISGANDARYKITSDDVGHSLSVKVTVFTLKGEMITRTAPAVTNVEPPAPAVSSAASGAVIEDWDAQGDPVAGDFLAMSGVVTAEIV